MNTYWNGLKKSIVIDLVSEAIHVTAKSLKILGCDYHLTDEAPESFDELLECCTSNIPIASYGSSTSALSQEANTELRFIHDYIHIEYYLDFSLEEEIEVARIQSRVLYEAMCRIAESRGLSIRYAEAGSDFLHYDSVGQVKYYYKHGKFVENQDAFVDECFKHGIEKVIKHEF